MAEVVVMAETILEIRALHIKGETVLLLEAGSFAAVLTAIDKLLARYLED